MARQVVVGIISFYQKTLSPDHGRMKVFYPNGLCRFTPSCSEYTKQAVLKYGVIKGLMLGCNRVGRCHPWSAGGHDPIP